MASSRMHLHGGRDGDDQSVSRWHIWETALVFRADVALIGLFFLLQQINDMQLWLKGP